jgi:hypothetical protein
MKEFQSIFLNRSVHWPTLCFLSLIMCGTSLFAGPNHAISLHIVDSKSGLPINNVAVSVVKWKDGRVENLAQGTTDKNGLFVFDLSEPLPDRIGFGFPPDALKLCSDLGFPTVEIINIGLLAKNKCQPDKREFSFTLKPGEITIFGNRVSLWERLRRELP